MRLFFDAASTAGLWRVLCVTLDRRNCANLALLVTTIMLSEYAASFLMDSIAGFYSSISSGDKALFLHTFVYSSVVILVIAVVNACKLFLVEYCTVVWRGALTRRLLLIAINEDAGRALLGVSGDIERLEGADQRVSQDAADFAATLAKTVKEAGKAPFIIAFYTWQLQSLFGIIAPVVCYLYFLVGASLSSIIMLALPELVRRQEELEGVFRVRAVTYFAHLEAVLFLKGCSFELDALSRCFEAVVTQRLIVARKHFSVAALSELFSYGGSVLNYAIIGYCVLYAPRSTLSPSDRAALLSKGSFACMYLLSGFSSVLTAYSFFGDLLGLSMRVHALLRLDEKLNLDANPSQEPSRSPLWPRPLGWSSVQYDTLASMDSAELGHCQVIPPDAAESASQHAVLLIVSGLDVCLFDALHSEPRVLVRGLSLEVCTGMRLLITGTSGCGKTSIFRLLSGIFRTSQVRMLTQRVFFSPQLPYCFAGSLFENVQYPLSEAFNPAKHGAVLTSILAELDLMRLYERYGDCAADLHLLLSPGEKQMLSVARALFHAPEIVFLDEATSFLDEKSQSIAYAALRRRCLAIVSIGHRGSLLSLHSQVLHIDNGSAELSDIPNSD